MNTLIAANWKMHGDMSWLSKPAELQALLHKPASPQPRSKQNGEASYDILLCPPSILLAPLYKVASPLGYFIGGQDCHWQDSGAHTGEISAAMLKSVGASHVILGHSERRAAGESDEQVRAKLTAALIQGLCPIVCVGETREQREQGRATIVVDAQLEAALKHTKARDEHQYQAIGSNIIIAYEPVWAIGTGLTPSLEDIADMHSHIRKRLNMFDRKSDGEDERPHILYGGSVKPSNASAILALPDVTGALIGGASLTMDSLAAIVKASEEVKASEDNIG